MTEMLAMVEKSDDKLGKNRDKMEAGLKSKGTTAAPKTVTKAPVKPVAKATAKPVAKPAVKPAAKAPAKPVAKAKPVVKKK